MSTSQKFTSSTELTPTRRGYRIESPKRIVRSILSLINLKCVDRPTLIAIMNTCKKFHINNRITTIEH